LKPSLGVYLAFPDADPMVEGFTKLINSKFFYGQPEQAPSSRRQLTAMNSPWTGTSLTVHPGFVTAPRPDGECFADGGMD